VKRIWYMSIKKAAKGYKTRFMPVQNGREMQEAAIDTEQADLDEVERLVRRVAPKAYVSETTISGSGLLGLATLPEEPLEALVQRIRHDLESPKGSSGVLIPLLTRSELEEMAARN